MSSIFEDQGDANRRALSEMVDKVDAADKMPEHEPELHIPDEVLGQAETIADGIDAIVFKSLGSRIANRVDRQSAFNMMSDAAKRGIRHGYQAALEDIESLGVADG